MSNDQSPLDPRKVLMLVMVLWWKRVVSRNSDFVPAHFASVDSAIRSAHARIVKLAERGVLDHLQKLPVFIGSHARESICQPVTP